MLVAVLGVGFLVWLGTSGPPPGSPASAATAPVANDYGQAGVPPWPAPADPTPGAQAAGIPLSSSEGSGQHFHAHLDVFVDGRAVPVPADLGIDRTAGRLAALHTHDTSGVLHIESPSPNNRYILGQLFNEWNVRLAPTAIGGLPVAGANTLTAYVNGQKVDGNPAAIPLAPHAEIALVYGPPGSGPPPPATYNFGDL